MLSVKMIWASAAMLALVACAEQSAARLEYERMPRELRTGGAAMAVGRVEAEVSREEVADAVRSLVERAPLCLDWPGLWLQGNDRRRVYIVRFDLMRRDWGGQVAVEGTQRMQEFVDAGFLLARERPDIGPGAVEYTLTTEGARYLVGTPYAGVGRPKFCAPARRRMIEITGIEWGQSACGNLRVAFTHVAEAWPIWARTDGVRSRIAEGFGPLGVVATGNVTLGRQWFRPNEVPNDMPRNGALRSVCFDAQHQRIVGDDLTLNHGPDER